MGIIPQITFNSVRIIPDLVNFHFLFLTLLFLFSFFKISMLLFYFNYLLLKAQLVHVLTIITNILFDYYYVLLLQILHLLNQCNEIGNQGKQILGAKKSQTTLVLHQLMFSDCQRSRQSSIVLRFDDFILNTRCLIGLYLFISFYL